MHIPTSASCAHQKYSFYMWIVHPFDLMLSREIKPQNKMKLRSQATRSGSVAIKHNRVKFFNDINSILLLDLHMNFFITAFSKKSCVMFYGVGYYIQIHSKKSKYEVSYLLINTSVHYTRIRMCTQILPTSQLVWWKKKTKSKRNKRYV